MNTKQLFTTLVIILIAINGIMAQSFPKEAIMKKLKADKIEMDAGNGDGVFKARDKNTQKWGMYQWKFEGTNVKMMIPMEYDSIKYFPFNGSFTAVYNNGKIGIYLCEWSYGDDAKQTVKCLYEDYKRFDVKVDQFSTQLYLAMKKEGKWGWVNWLTGKEESEFIYDTTDELPFPHFEQKSF